jgi:hypothetical protein
VRGPTTGNRATARNGPAHGPELSRVLKLRNLLSCVFSDLILFPHRLATSFSWWWAEEKLPALAIPWTH